MSTLLIRGGHLIDPAAGVDALMDVVLRDGRVAEIIAPGSLSSSFESGPDVEVIDGSGLTVAPGLVDIHVHQIGRAHV